MDEERRIWERGVTGAMEGVEVVLRIGVVEVDRCRESLTAMPARRFFISSVSPLHVLFWCMDLAVSPRRKTEPHLSHT